MDFGAKIENVLNRMVIPDYPDLTLVVCGPDRSKPAIKIKDRFYKIIFIIKDGCYDKVDNRVMKEVMDKTETLIDMVGLNEGEYYLILFRSENSHLEKWLV